ncbi:MarR family winged helix-turn-helix transcriptional regulator [Nonomuraea sp. NPDC050790]|uniref:MarR family winged helix-turn-helix transcriptional regulator n=1 Tax=Nonomuraea sp. NPDC050790 TaxID=3364371 RepID=UPI0037981134
MEHDEVDALAARWQAAGMAPSLIAGLELSKRASRINVLFEQALKGELAALGLTYAEFDVLAALARTAPPYRMKPSELARSLMLTSGGTSNVLQRLTTAGYVERAPDDGDGRSRWVQLTPEGLKLATTALDTAARANTNVLAGVPEPVIRQAADALRQVLLQTTHRRLR